MQPNNERESLESRVRDVVKDAGFLLQETEHVGARQGRYAGTPPYLARPLGQILQALYPSGLYSHQALALNHLGAGRDVCLTTSTASGKSLVFMAGAAELLLRDPNAKVICLYPAKALIQDQLDKWRKFLETLSLRPGYIDGAVPMDVREKTLTECRVVLMTPDVAHAWMMSRASQAPIRPFLDSVRMLVLDEAHVYDGVFGTNMAYFIRRLLAVSAIDRVIASTATIGEPASLLERLTGRDFVVVDDGDDGAPRPSKSILLVRGGDKSFDNTVTLIRELASRGMGRFLAFADSRRMVEQIVAASERGAATSDQSEDEGPEDAHDAERSVLPYRSGYEEEDRKGIQRALTEGTLAGVVSTSALELGLDVGEIDIVILLDSPPTVKAFWQRVGRAGRRNPAVCVLIDSRGTVGAQPDGLRGYLRRAVEPGWLYLQNRYLQYTQALCAAHEIAGLGGRADRSRLSSLPAPFNEMLENELNPVEAVAEDLYHLKQRGQAGPHYEFPVRSGIEKGFVVREHLIGARSLGTVTFSQVLREAFPGAIYYYMARPYRVTQVNYRAGEVAVKGTKRWTTRATLQNMVFPRLQGFLNGKRSGRGFIVETPLQVSERVVGFTEKRGPNKQVHVYGPGSPFAQRPLQRMLDTTGVCWHFDEPRSVNLAVGEAVLEAFAALCGIEMRDIGVGLFHTKPSAFWATECQGVCIYDATHGSLRLTQQLAERFEEVCAFALKLDASGTMISGGARDESGRGIQLLASLVAGTERVGRSDRQEEEAPQDPTADIVRVIAANQPAVLLDEVSREVRVIAFRYTPKGPMYQLESLRPGNTWMVPREAVQPISGVTLMEELNLVTGERRSLGEAE